MEEIQGIVDEIVAQCRAYGSTVSEHLAAFVARTVVNEFPNQFRMDKEMNDDDLRDLVRLSVQRLLERDSPPMETIKMQVAFDTAYVQNEDAIEKSKASKENKLNDMQRVIIASKPKSGSDFESLTALYRQIFNYLLKHADAEKVGDRNVEREIAAALESVFPRIGLKSFISLPSEEKKNQLTELANIVLGIRLFNQEIGKGGAGLDDTVNLCSQEVTALIHKLQGEVDEVSEQCQQYTDLLIFSHHFRPESISDDMIKRWQDELTNKRQYLSYCQSLQEDAMLSAQKTESHKDNYAHEMEDLKAMVGSRSSVPKEQVYPKFDTLATLWQLLASERKLVTARESTRQTLVQFKASYTSTLSPEFMLMVNDGKVPTKEEESEQAVNQLMSQDLLDPSSGDKDETTTANQLAPEVDDDSEQPTRLSIESTPEFMQLPLEYQGYCPWTIVHRKGLLLPGNPSIGVVRYRNSFNVFVHETALKAFMENPRRYTDAVIDVVGKHPEMIHLLRLQEHFPDANLSKILGTSNPSRTDGFHPLLGPSPPAMIDACTETPVHFVEKNIDPNYDWNEWSLRRKALKLAQLRKCRTVSTQTDLSHFRRENETQHFSPRDWGTQTATSRGTNPPRMVNYVAGLRGGPVQNGTELEFGQNGTKYVEEDFERPEEVISTVTLTYEV